MIIELQMSAGGLNFSSEGYSNSSSACEEIELKFGGTTLTL
jgi:hypothetical protein